MKALLLVFLAVGSLGTPAFGLDLGDIVKGIELARGGDRGRDPGDRWPGRPGPGRPGPGRGELRCNATDKGWEEHWGGHYDCRECLSKHDGCTETCAEVRTIHTCAYEGYGRDGRREQITASSDDRYYAERDARDRCERYYGYRSCRFMGCNQRDESQVVSRRDCGRR